VLFCRQRHEKAAICRELGLTHFIDDRLEVLSHLLGYGSPSLPFPVASRHVDRFRRFLPHVRMINQWSELVDALL
jgi:hypothetical protein